jgi:hypothetical protein
VGASRLALVVLVGAGPGCTALLEFHPFTAAAAPAPVVTAPSVGDVAALAVAYRAALQDACMTGDLEAGACVRLEGALDRLLAAEAAQRSAAAAELSDEAAAIPHPRRRAILHAIATVLHRIHGGK